MIVNHTNQTDLRNRLLNYQTKKGVKWLFIADILEISKFTMSDFKNGRVNLHDGTAKKLDEFLKSENF